MQNNLILKIKIITTCDQKSTNDTEYCDPSLKAGQGIPLEFYPGMGGELCDDALDFTPVRRDLIQATPVVLLVIISLFNIFSLLLIVITRLSFHKYTIYTFHSDLI